MQKRLGGFFAISGTHGSIACKVPSAMNAVQTSLRRIDKCGIAYPAHRVAWSPNERALL